MPDVMMAIGDFVFSVDGAAYQKLLTASPMRWEAQERIGRSPALQFIGVDVETIDIEGVIYPGFLNGSTQSLDDLRALAAEGEPLELVDGQGTAWGRYVIEEVTDTYTFFHSNGVPRKIEFSARLKLYGDDEADENVTDPDGDGIPNYVPDDVAAFMSVNRYEDPALTRGGNGGAAGVLRALTSGRMTPSSFPSALQGQVGGSLRPAILDDGSIVLTGEAGIGVGLDGVGRARIGKSQSVTLGNINGGDDVDGGGAAP
jgi:phage protein U